MERNDVKRERILVSTCGSKYRLYSALMFSLKENTGWLLYD